MKELSIEEKAYNNLIERLKDFQFEYRFSPFSDTIDRYFPELKQSKDERIKKELIEYFKWNVEQILDNFDNKEVLAWLERQDEKKLVDKIEPKFKDRDWVVTSYGKVNQVVSVNKDDYGYTLDDGTYFNGSWCDMYHLWTIQDAKDGDVLVSELNCGLGTWYCIFKSLDGDDSMTVYCYLTRDGRFETKKELCFDKDPYNTKPATKEQHELLFSKMKEAGYEWDADKKELKKINDLTQQETMDIAVAKCFECNEQKSTDNVEPKFNVGQTIKKEGFNAGFTIVKVNNGFYYNNVGDHFPFTDQDNWELVEQKSTEWSEEDEEMYNAISIALSLKDAKTYLRSWYKTPEEADNWLKSLKDRVHLQNTYYNNNRINIEVWITKNKQWILKLNGKVVRGQWGDEPQCIYKQFFNLNELISTDNKKE